MFGATVSTPLPLLLEVPLRLRLVPRYRYCLEFRALRLGSLLGLGLGLPVTAKARSRAMDRSTARATASLWQHSE